MPKHNHIVHMYLSFITTLDISSGKIINETACFNRLLTRKYPIKNTWDSTKDCWLQHTNIFN